MARSRNIKPGFFQNDELVELPYEYRLLFIGLWTLADREGRLEDRPKKIKMSLFPADDIDINQGLSELGSHKLVFRYEVDNNKYIQILTFNKHQRPHHQEIASVIPAPDLSEPVATLSGEGANHFARNPPDSLNPITDSLNLIPSNTASDDAVLVTKKKRKLSGWKLETFFQFWEAFDYKRGKTEAADAWYDIEGLTPLLAERIIQQAGTEALYRPMYEKQGRTPKMAQGWLSGKRWEDEIKAPVTQSTPGRMEIAAENLRENFGTSVDQESLQVTGPGTRSLPKS